MDMLYSIIGILIPFLGTTLGSALVFVMKNEMDDRVHKIILGFAAGVMIAASVWSLLIPSMSMASEQNIASWFPASLGFIIGIIFLIFINKIAYIFENRENGKKLDMLMFSVTLHNIPEGMAVGVCFAGFLAGTSGISLLASMVLAIGIAIQNIPEGAIISVPLRAKKMSKVKSFVYGVLSGVVEPVFAIITVLLLNIVVPILPYLLSFAAGAMIFVVCFELIPEMHNGNKSTLGVVGVSIGFFIMMILDVVLG